MFAPVNSHISAPKRNSHPIHKLIRACNRRHNAATVRQYVTSPTAEVRLGISALWITRNSGNRLRPDRPDEVVARGVGSAGPHGTHHTSCRRNCRLPAEHVSRRPCRSPHLRDRDRARLVTRDEGYAAADVQAPHAYNHLVSAKNPFDCPSSTRALDSVRHRLQYHWLLTPGSCYPPSA